MVMIRTVHCESFMWPMMPIHLEEMGWVRGCSIQDLP